MLTQPIRQLGFLDKPKDYPKSRPNPAVDPNAFFESSNGPSPVGASGGSSLVIMILVGGTHIVSCLNRVLRIGHYLRGNQATNCRESSLGQVDRRSVPLQRRQGKRNQGASSFHLILDSMLSF